MKIFQTRNQMIAALPKNRVIAELGVFKGEFSRLLLDICKPKELVLIDLWDGGIILSGDVDGNNVERINCHHLEKTVINSFQGLDHVIIRKGYTTEVLSEYPDNYFDVIYIDADHSYEGCKADLKMSYKKIKNGGYIMGHDYEQNFEKTENVYNFGVNRAVNEFCQKYSQAISIKANDGCVSYGIKIKK
jgi:hypothetical protein